MKKLTISILLVLFYGICRLSAQESDMENFFFALKLNQENFLNKRLEYRFRVCVFVWNLKIQNKLKDSSSTVNEIFVTKDKTFEQGFSAWQTDYHKQVTIFTKLAKRFLKDSPQYQKKSQHESQLSLTH